MTRTRFKLDIVEVTLIVVFAVIATRAASSVNPLLTDPSARWLESTYGPERNSQFIEEWIIRDFFKERRGGFFLDVGASHHQMNSNTYYLEKRLGWQGIAVEPILSFEAGYLQHRPRTRFLPFFAAERSHEKAMLYMVSETSLVSSQDRSFTERWGSDAKGIEVPTIALSDLLDHEGVKKVDLLSMDIELAEPRALAGFDIKRFAPDLVCIEGHPEVRQALLNYFLANDYVLVGNYLRADLLNLYFTPVRLAADLAPLPTR